MDQFLAATESALQSSNWYAALLVALALPDIAGWVNDPVAGSRARYAAWVEQYLSPTYTSEIGADHVQHKFLSGDDCYALRCSLLHEGRDEIAHQRAQDALDRFQFTAPTHGLIAHRNQVGAKLQLQVDVFCRDICQAIRIWLASIPAGDRDRRHRLGQLAVIHAGPGVQI